MFRYIRRNAWGVIGICLTAAAVVAILWFMPKNSAQSAPQRDVPVASPTSAAMDAPAQTRIGPIMGPAEPAPVTDTPSVAEPTLVPAPPAQAGPLAGANSFEDAVLLLEASRYMEDPASKNAALAQVATDEYQASHKMPADIVGVKLNVSAVPSKSQVVINDESEKEGVTYRTVSVYAYIEKHDNAGALVNVINNDKLPDVTTWELRPDHRWSIHHDGI
ncbi:MAG: hypothetical protein NVSMB39_2340 [Candidatus Saccharimonadales bacterium]